MAKRKKQQVLPWCWYCDREFEDEKVLINHQKAKHFKCHYCHKKLNSGSGLVIHIAQLHKETIFKIPNALEGHDTPEVEIYGMEGVPPEDLKRHRNGLPIIPFKRSRLTEPGAGMLPLLAAQKASIPDEPVAATPVAALPVSPLSSAPLPLTSTTAAPRAEQDGSSAIVSAAPISYTSPLMASAAPSMYMPPPGYPPYYGAPSAYGYYPPATQGYGYPPYYPPYGTSPYQSPYPASSYPPVTPPNTAPATPSDSGKSSAETGQGEVEGKAESK